MMHYSLKHFLPLLVMLAIVAGLSTIGVWQFGQDPMLAVMGYFFLVFGLLKVVRLRSFAKAYQMYDVVAMKSRAYAMTYPFLELGFAAAYLAAWQVREVSVVVTIVMLIGAYGVYKKLQQHEEVPCACLGTVFKIPMTWVTLGEDVIMAGMALWIVLGL